MFNGLGNSNERNFVLEIGTKAEIVVRSSPETPNGYRMINKEYRSQIQMNGRQL